MATSYCQPSTNASIGRGSAAPYSTPFSGVMQPTCAPQDRKLLDRFRDKMRSLHYSLATEKAYRHWIVEFLRFHRYVAIFLHEQDEPTMVTISQPANAPGFDVRRSTDLTKERHQYLAS